MFPGRIVDSSSLKVFINRQTFLQNVPSKGDFYFLIRGIAFKKLFLAMLWGLCGLFGFFWFDMIIFIIIIIPEIRWQLWSNMAAI